MAAEILKLDPDAFKSEALKGAAQALQDGGLVIFPRETTYAVGAKSGADGRNVAHLPDREAALRWAGKVPPVARRLMKHFWPGPLTLILKEGVAVRCPSHKIAQELLRLAGVPVFACSTGCAKGEDAARQWADRASWVIESGETRFKAGSTVVRVSDARCEIVREGAIGRSLIEEAGYRLVLFVCTGNTCRSPMAEAMARELAKGIRFESAGTGAPRGQDMAPNAAQVLREMGFRPGEHGSRALGMGLLDDADRIFVMEKAHRDWILGWVPEAASKVSLLDPQNKDLDDPVGGDIEVYRACAARIRRCLEERLKEL